MTTSERLLDSSDSQKDNKSGQASMSTFTRPVLTLSLGFFAVFLAFNTTQNLASSLNKSLANACFAALYGVFAIACLVAPRLVGSTFGPKLAMIIGGVPYCLMVFTYVKPMWATSLPAHIAVGCGAPLLWTGSAVFISRYAKYQSIMTGQPMSQTANTLNGLFFSLFHFTGFGLIIAGAILSIWGDKANLIMFLFLGVVAGLGLFIISVATSPPTPAELADIQRNQVISQRDAENQSINTDNEKEEDENKPLPSIFDVIKLIIFDRKMTFMSVLILYNGLSMAFLFSDLSGGVIGKAVGTKSLGFVLSSYYIFNSLFTMLWTKIINQRNTPIILCLFVLAHTGFLASLTFLPQSINFIANPDASAAEKQLKLFDPVLLDYLKGIMYCALFSLGDSILQQQNQSLLQTFYESDADKSDQSMSAMKLVQSAGIAIMFLVGLSTDVIQTKVNILWASLGVATIALFVIIIRWLPMTEGVVPDGDERLLQKN